MEDGCCIHIVSYKVVFRRYGERSTRWCEVSIPSGKSLAISSEKLLAVWPRVKTVERRYGDVTQCK
jgi:hypothetical protein